MNKVKKCSIAGVSFTLETDAYETLNAYIDSLRNAYKGNPDGEEIIADIEARIAELVLSTLPADSVVAKPLIDNIIRQLGSADEIDDEQAEKNTHNADKVDQNGNPRIPRRLYRDLSNGKLGGVCAGLANYFDVDTVWIRLAMLLPLLFSPVFKFTFERGHFVSFSTNLFWFVAIGYIIMWIVIPAASSARQKLEMKGERVTARNISEKAYASAADEPARTIFANIVALIGRILLILLKIFAALIFIGLIGGATLLGVVAVAAIPIMSLEFTTGLTALAFVMMILIPIIVLIYLTLMLLLSMRPKASVLLVLFIIWILMIPALIVSALKSPRNFDSTIENLFESVVEKDEKILYKEFTDDEIQEWQQKHGVSSETIEEEEKMELGTAGVKKMTHHFTIGDERASSHYQAQMHIMFCGADDAVKACEESLKFDSDFLTFTTSKGSKVKAGKNGIDFNGSTLKMVTKKSIDINGKDITTTYNFSVDGVKVQFQQGPLIDMNKVTKEMVEGIFGATSKIFDAAGNIFGMAGNIIGAASNIVDAAGAIAGKEAIAEAQEDIREAQQEIAEAQKEFLATKEDIHNDMVISLTEPTRGATTATKPGTESWATNPKVYYYPVNGKVVKGYSHDGVYILFYGSAKSVDCCMNHFAIDKNGYVSTWTKAGNKYLISKYGIKADEKDGSKKKSIKCNKNVSKGEYGDEYLIYGEIDDVKFRYLVGDRNNPTTKDKIAHLSKTSYVQSLF